MTFSFMAVGLNDMRLCARDHRSALSDAKAHGWLTFALNTQTMRVFTEIQKEDKAARKCLKRPSEK